MKTRILLTARLSFPLASALAALLATPATSAANYYWDNDGTGGFGNAGGTWTAPTLSQWSTDPNGVLPAEASITTATTDALNFGNGAIGLAAGTIAVSGTVDAGTMTFASGSGAIALAGDPINLADAATLTVNNASDTISSILGGAATSLTKAGAGILNLPAANSYTGTTTINAGTLILNDANGAIASSSAVSVGAAAGPAGILTLDNGTANQPDRVGSVDVAFNNGTLNFIGNTATASTESIGTITAATGHTLVNLSGGAAGQVAMLTSTAGAITRTAGATLTIVTDNTNQQFAFIDGSAGINKGVFFGASAATAADFAYYPGTSAAVLAPTYGTSTDFAAETNTALTANQHNKLNGSIASQGAETIYSLNLPGNFSITELTGNLTFTSADDQGAILKSGGGAAQIGTAGNLFDIAGQSGGELVVNAVATADILTLNVGTTATSTALTKTGAGTLTLTANRDYLHTGTTTVNQGTLELNSATTAGFKSNVTIHHGGTVKLATANKVVDTAVLIVNAGGTLDLNGKAEMIARTAGSGTVTNSGTLATLTMTGATTTVPNAIGGALNLSVQGASTTYTLTGTNTYSGSTTIGKGGTAATKVILGSANALPSGTAVTADGGGTNVALDLNGFDQTIGLVTLGSNSGGGQTTVTGNGTSKLTLTAGATVNGHNNGAGLISVPFLDLNNATQTFTLTGSTNAASSFTVSSVIQNGALTRAGTNTAGALILTKANTFSGATTISTGILQLNHNLALQHSAIDTTGTGTIVLGTGITTPTFGGLNGSDALRTTLIATTGYNLVTALTLNPGLGAAPSYSGVISNGAAGMTLTKTGAGTQTLSGASTYTGNTLVNDGTLHVTAAGSLRFRPTTNGLTNAVSGSASAALTFAGTVNLDLSAASAADGNSWNLFNKASVPTALTPAAVTSTTLGSFAQAAPGVWELPVAGAKWVFTTADGTLAYTAVAGYPSWASLNVASANLNEDHDNDGVPNGVEYFIGGTTLPEANTTGFTPLPGVLNTAGVLSVTWTKAATYGGVYPTNFVVETSNTLAAGGWIAAATSATPAIPNTVYINGNTITYTFPAGTKTFARLKVTGP